MMGNWNAVVGEGKENPLVGKFGLGKRNRRGQRLVDFCNQEHFVITNTYFEMPYRRRGIHGKIQVTKTDIS